MTRRLDWERAQAREARSERLRLDRAPKGKPNAEPISDKQRDLITALANDLGVSVPDGIVTRSGAMNAIQDLKRRKRQRELLNSRG